MLKRLLPAFPSHIQARAVIPALATSPNSILHVELRLNPGSLRISKSLHRGNIVRSQYLYMGSG